MGEDRKLRILMANAGLDVEERDAKAITRALRDAGFEVIFTHLDHAADGIVFSAIQEDANAIGLWSDIEDTTPLFEPILEQLQAQGIGDIVVFGGGVIPHEMIDELLAAGVRRIFPRDASAEEVIEFLRKEASPMEGGLS
ncbi:MAG: cobalamin B12-binding domain-containing protein [Deltaproteobacteria bacterium]|nr:cobalamin B12-binding domain-containing protein [Deltaproteobacteria bacterium]MCB9489810.1 cobalamin B12-binding domain-containing protein [Deltaproteobacteria bacterium]